MVSETDALSRLRDCIVNFDLEGVQEACESALAAGIPAYVAITDGLSKGMEIIGQRYESQECFLSELLMSAETMKEAMKVLQPHLKKGDMKATGRVVIGTVRGDLHDIGKNIVAALLSGAGFEVVDLGVDVAAQTFVNKIAGHNADIVAMSALLTSTMSEMGTIIEEICRRGLRDKVKVIIGGAPVTAEFAKRVGADGVARDAVEGTRICREWMIR